jgi:UDP-3-O-[3-hydroxymyristoyl] glucosamine N-acyltransferase
MSPYSVINGDCGLGEAVFLGSRVTLNPEIKIGDFTVIDAGCILQENIGEFSLVS